MFVLSFFGGGVRGGGVRGEEQKTPKIIQNE